MGAILRGEMDRFDYFLAAMSEDQRAVPDPVIDRTVAVLVDLSRARRLAHEMTAAGDVPVVVRDASGEGLHRALMKQHRLRTAFGERFLQR